MWSALDKHTGKVRWKQNRSGRMAYTTPLVIRAQGVDQVISIGGDRAVAYDPLSGREIWWLRYDGYSNVPRPVFGLGLVFLCTGYTKASLNAIRPDGKGDVTDTHVMWRLRQGVPLNPSPLLVDEELYLVSDAGISTCLDARTGRSHWRERLGGDFSASPIYADGRIYFLNEEGVTTVLSHGTAFNKLSTNSLKGRTLASMAISGKSIYLRTDHHLYRIEEASE